MSADIVVGLLTLLGLMYVAWVQTDSRRAENRSNDAEAIEFSAGAVTHMTTSLMQVIEKLADRDRLIAELRTRVESLEERDRQKTQCIAELEQKIKELERKRQEIKHERDALAEEVAKLKVTVLSN